jgi:hypothetical protein
VPPPAQHDTPLGVASAGATPALQRTHVALRALARHVTGEGPGALVFITFANEAFLDMLNNWVVHALRSGVAAFLVGAMDGGVRRYCSQQGLLSWPMDDEGLLDLVAASNGTLGRLADSNIRHVCSRRPSFACSCPRRAQAGG